MPDNGRSHLTDMYYTRKLAAIDMQLAAIVAYLGVSFVEVPATEKLLRAVKTVDVVEGVAE